MPQAPQDEERITLLWRAVQNVRVVSHLQHRHGRREQARAQFAPLTAAHPHTYLTFANLPPGARPDTTLATPCPMLRCVSSKIIALVVIALDIDEKTRSRLRRCCSSNIGRQREPRISTESGRRCACDGAPCTCVRGTARPRERRDRVGKREVPVCHVSRQST